MLKEWESSEVVYFTCHDNYGSDDYFINCKNRRCDPGSSGPQAKGQELSEE